MQLDLQDRVWQWSTWTKEDYNIFKIHETKKRPYEFRDNVHIQVTFEFDLDFTVTDRQVYSILDWLGDTGGLVEALFFIGGTVLILFNYTQFESLMVRHLYRIRPKNDNYKMKFQNSEKTLDNSDHEGEIISKVSDIRALA